MSWKRNHCLLKYTLCEAKRPVNENVRTIAPTRDCMADFWSANTKMKITGRKEKRLITTRSMGSRRRGKASNSPMYSASRILDFNRSPHDLDEGLLEARRFEGHLPFLAQTALDDREDFLRGPRLEHFGRARPVPRRVLDDHPHSHAGVSLRLFHGSVERGPAFVHNEQVVREHFGLIEVMRRQEDRRAFPSQLPQHMPDGTPAERVEPDRRFVEEQDLGVRHERHGDDQTLAEPPRQVRGELVAVFPKAQIIHDLARAFAGRPTGLTAYHAEVEDVVVRRKEHLRPGFLGDDRDVRTDGLRVLEDIVAEDERATRGRLELGREDPQEGRLPRAVAAEQAEDLAFVDREGDAFESLRAAGVCFPRAIDPAG